MLRRWDLIDLRHVENEQDKRDERQEDDDENRDDDWRNAVTERSRLMKATGMRIMIRIERMRSSTARVVDKKREVGDVLTRAKTNEQMFVPVRRSGGCLRFGRGHDTAFIHVSIEPHRVSLFQNNDLWATRRIV